MVSCLCFGDSITYGEYDGIFGGWVDILKRYFHREKKMNNAKELNVFNLGKGGETTDGLVKRIQVESEARKSPEENVVFFGYGANDLALVDGNPQVSVAQYQNNLHRAITVVKGITQHVYAINILPIASEIDGVIGDNGKLRSNTDVELYNKTVLDIVKETGIGLIDVNTLFIEDRKALLSNDGLHPNEVGYMKMAEKIKPILKQFL